MRDFPFIAVTHKSPAGVKRSETPVWCTDRLAIHLFLGEIHWLILSRPLACCRTRRGRRNLTYHQRATCDRA